MKFSIFKISLLFLAGSLVFSSCGEDDIVIDPGTDPGDMDQLNVQDGLFLALDGADPSSTAVLETTVVEAEGFSVQERSGYVQGYMWLEAGSYSVVQVENRAVVATIGGVAETLADGAPSECGHNAITVVTTEADGAPFTVGTSGLYQVSHDQTTSELVLYNIVDASVIGSATEGGWSADTPLVGSATADGATWEATDVVLRSGEWKVRLNCNWNINRRIDPNGSLDDVANGYQPFTNFGGASNDLQIGGANIQQMEDGLYTVNLAWGPRDGFALSVTRTGDAPIITFNPNDFQMAVIGDATAMGWDADRNLFHKEEGGVHTWYGVVTFTDTGLYKFRANDAWDFNLGGDLANLSNGGSDIPTPGAGGYYIALSTADEGDTWSAVVNDLGWSIIGEGSPVANWENDLAMDSQGFANGVSTYTASGDFTTGGWKFRAGRDWPLNLGGDLSFLNLDGDNIALTDPGTFTVTLSYDGEVYTATVQ